MVSIFTWIFEIRCWMHLSHHTFAHQWSPGKHPIKAWKKHKTRENLKMPLDIGRMDGTTHLGIHDNEFVWRSLLLVLGSLEELQSFLQACHVDMPWCLKVYPFHLPSSVIACVKVCIIRDFPQRLGPRFSAKDTPKQKHAGNAWKIYEKTKKHRGAQFYMLRRFFHFFNHGSDRWPLAKCIKVLTLRSCPTNMKPWRTREILGWNSHEKPWNKQCYFGRQTRRVG